MSEPITPPSTPDEFNKTNNNDLIFQPNLSPTPTLKPSVSKSTATSIKESVQVLVRCRPPSERERLERPCWYVRPEEGSIELLQIKNPTSGYSFHYDKVIEGVDNSQVYKAGIQELVRSAMKGYNGTVFAYGQTASGKTYTMMGTEQEPGVTPRAVEEVFSYINTDTSGREYMLRVSYMEIYNEKMKDLFNPKDGQPEIVEDKKQITVRNLKEHIVKTPQEVMEFIKEGEKNRHVSATDYNEQSSRSHSIFQIVIESRSPHELTQVRLSQLNLIDLAGSEKVTSDMERRMEGSYINKSLLTLGNVISKLTSDEPVTHIPFRNSKLTRILQTALSGNARIAVICTINPTFASKDESLNTLRFAQRAKLVKTAAKMTSIMDKSELKKCLIKIAELQTQMREKTELEVATRESLKNLLGLILTGSKEEEQKGLLARLDNISTEDVAAGDATMRDVVVRCQEGFTAQINAYRQYISEITSQLESTRDRQHIMETIQVQQKDQLDKRDAQIEHLKQELNKRKQQQPQPSHSATTATALPTPSTSSSTHHQKRAYLSAKYCKSATNHLSNSISDAITSALNQPSSPNPAISSAISSMIYAYFPSNLPIHELNQALIDKTVIDPSILEQAIAATHSSNKHIVTSITESVSFIPAYFYLPSCIDPMVPDLVYTNDDYDEESNNEWIDLKPEEESSRDDHLSMDEEEDEVEEESPQDHLSTDEEEESHGHLSIKEEEEESHDHLSTEKEPQDMKEEPSTPSPLQQENNRLTLIVHSAVDASVQTSRINYTDDISRALDQLVEIALPSPDTDTFNLEPSMIVEEEEEEDLHIMRPIQQPTLLYINKWSILCLIVLVYSHYYF